MKYAFVVILCALVYNLHAQSYSAGVRYDKTDRQGLVLQLPYVQSVSESFIVDNLRKTGYDPETKGKLFWKQGKINDFYLFKGVTLPGASVPVDLYFKVDGNGKAKDQSTIYMLVSRGSENFIGPGQDTAFVAAQQFLNSFVPQSVGYKLNLDIDGQEKTVRDAEKRLEKLQADEADINRKVEQLQKDLRDNAAEQSRQRGTIESERAKLNELKTRAAAKPAVQQ